jgi:hypothetical protein
VLEKQHSSLHVDYVALAARVQAQQEQLQQAQDTAAQLRLEREGLQLQLTTAQQAAARHAQDQQATLVTHQREMEVLRGDRDAAVSAHQAALTSLCRAEEQVRLRLYWPAHRDDLEHMLSSPRPAHHCCSRQA